MVCSYKCRVCRVCWYIRRHAKNFIIKTLCMINGFSLIFWACLIDSVISWQPYAIMLGNLLFLWLVAYANNWTYGKNQERRCLLMAAEKQFENKVKKFLKSKGCWYIKYWGGAAYTKSGIPDLLVSCSGHFMGIELKAPNGRPAPLQIVSLREIDRSGGYAILLYPDDYPLFQSLVQCIQAGDQEGAESVYTVLKSKWKHFENKMKKGE